VTTERVLPMCACNDFWPTHHPDCPVRREYERAVTGAQRYRCTECDESFIDVNAARLHAMWHRKEIGPS